MLNLVKLLSFVAICAIAAYAGNNLARGFERDMECRNWTCAGTVGQCTLSGPQIRTCFNDPPDFCELVPNTWMMCNGTFPNMQQCYWFYNRCVLAPAP
jgi:hypothetical protein